MSRLRRFLHLERPRGSEASDGPARATGGRFAGVERPGPAPAGSGSGAALERFGPEPDPPLELDDWRRAGPAAAERGGAEPRLGAELEAARRAMGEELAREIGERERRRLGTELGRGGWAERLLAAVLSGRRRRW